MPSELWRLIQSMLIDVKLRERTEMTHARMIEWHQRTHCEVACESVVGVKADVTFVSADFGFWTQVGHVNARNETSAVSSKHGSNHYSVGNEQV